MNQNLPKPMLDALARQALPTEHPSVDVLNAFAENALAGDEYRSIADHLARCSECREIVFLSVGAADEPSQVEEHVAAAYGTRRKWMPRLVWGASIAAAVLVFGSAMTLWRSKSAPSGMPMASRTVAIPAAQPAEQAELATAPQTTTEVAAIRPIEKPQAKTARSRNVAPQGAETLGMGASAGIVAGAVPAPAKAAPAKTVKADSITIATSDTAATIGTAATTAPATPHVNSFAATQGGPLAAAPGSVDTLLLSRQAAVRSMRAANLWRITDDGHLEHSTAQGWTRILADQKATFRVVSVVGNQVWVGGSGGALLHSHDDGQNWEEVALNTPTGRETSTIVSIKFEDLQHGTVTTSNGTRCTTTDGGGSWSCGAAQE
jgi:hypothetical protein